MTIRVNPNSYLSDRVSATLNDGAGHVPPRMEYDIILGQGTPDLPTPPYILDAVDRALRTEPRVQYTDYAGIPELRQAIATKLVRDNDLHYDPETEIMVTNGAQEAVWITMQLLVNPGDEFLIGDPHYTVYDEMISLLGGTAIPIPSIVEQGFQYNLAAMESAITPRTKGIILVSPDNPTGAVQTPVTVRAIADFADRHQIFVVSDELYERFIFDEATFTSFASLPGQRDRTITIGGFSKAWAMTGWRVGYLAFPAALRAAALLIKHSISICTAVPSQFAALAALTGQSEILGEMMSEWSDRRSYLFQSLEEMTVPVIRTPGAYYALVDIRQSGLSDVEFASRFATEERVRVSPGSAFGPAGRGFVRVSFMTPRPQLDQALERLGTFWNSLMNA